ncbi:MAG: sulfate permease, partial [Desulfobacterales bacterium]|nr:sulfate permease [Desulfobacterales bacterium]
GVLLIFAGAELGRCILDIQDRKDLFVILSILAITLTTDLAAGFLAGLVLAILLRSRHFRV